ncbi:MAG TPA: M20/M25/M40 family metallo-hydrolase [Gemmatimonadaceae bacterium]|nr:M20/M25/M40 family metallo-hydrolase [Gemmatimonadaceae bacterium]
MKVHSRAVVRPSHAAMVASLAMLFIAPRAGAQRLTGYSAAESARQRAAEIAAVAIPDATRAAAHSRALSDRPHLAGTEAQAQTRDYVIARLQAMGLETEVREYQVWLPHPTSIRAWRVAPNGMELEVSEGPVGEDPTSSAWPQIPAIAGYGAHGDVAAELVYVNYGLIEDYAVLDSMGVSVRGKIVIARYGRSFRGIKAREAEARGAIGLFVYSDPIDDGFMVGDPYPVGPMRPAHGVQRGSFMNGAGDPSTPGWPSTANARRLAPAEMNVPRIPIVPISHASAAELMRDLRGASIPQAWQGAMAFRYHVGPGPVAARIRVETDAQSAGYKPVWNTFGIIRGTELPDEMVVIGAHRDSWGPGTADNISGTVSVLEAARAVAEQMKQGWRPRRTMVFATWDAEEWGLVGSSEYVEDDSLRLSRGAVAYLNQDVAAQGSRFGAGGSPSLRALMRDIVSTIQYPADTANVYRVWRRQAAIADSLEPPMGDPGGGSDFAGFYNHLGIPHLDWGFGGPGGVYHSAYDSYSWMTRFGDPGFVHHAAAARIGTALMMRIANAEILPYDYVEFARTMRRYLPVMERSLEGMRGAATTAPLREAIDAFERNAARFANARDAALAQPLAKDTRIRANAALIGVERALTRPAGLRTRPWYRNLIYASDENNGYATMPLPSINEAIRRGDTSLIRTEIADLADRFRAAAAKIDEARVALAR